MSQHQRPTSPHATIYRWQITNTLSILHRLTGLALVAGSALLVVWLWSAAYSPECFEWIRAVFHTMLGKAALIGWTAAFYYHLANGIRHLFWDMGKGFELDNVYKTGWIVVIFTLGLTAFTWYTVCERSLMWGAKNVELVHLDSSVNARGGS